MSEQFEQTDLVKFCQVVFQKVSCECSSRVVRVLSLSIWQGGKSQANACCGLCRVCRESSTEFVESAAQSVQASNRRKCGILDTSWWCRFLV